MESDEYSAAEEAESYMWIDSVLLPSQQKKRKKGRDENKRRFSEEQIKSLETMFESQAKLEPRKKLQLARELGLQPRQVAIWFQNKRARWKSKQLEREYAALKADYEALLSDLESLKQEKHHLIKQLQRLSELLNQETDDAGKRQASCVSSGGEDLLLLTDEVPTGSSCLALDEQQIAGNCPCSPEKRAAAGSDWWEYHWLTD